MKLNGGLGVGVAALVSLLLGAQQPLVSAGDLPTADVVLVGATGNLVSSARPDPSNPPEGSTPTAPRARATSRAAGPRSNEPPPSPHCMRRRVCRRSLGSRQPTGSKPSCSLHTEQIRLARLLLQYDRAWHALLTPQPPNPQPPTPAPTCLPNRPASTSGGPCSTCIWSTCTRQTST